VWRTRSRRTGEYPGRLAPTCRGKTTFIRTVAVNAVLAQTIATCLAHRYEATLFNVQTSIGRTDSLSEGKSYYIAEVECIAGFLADGTGSSPYLFVIDEIFRGTNTTERVAASKAVLDALNRADGPHIVLVSTHDIELSFLLQTVWDRYHFQEAVEDGELAFDYKIRTGLCSSRNALRLLAARDYPAAVVADAEATAAQIDIVKE
jgi:DNA mismatch repair ATPase MutS